jgi:hypothetical protein
LVLDVVYALLEQAGDVVIVDGVVDLATSFARSDDAHLAQAAKLMGDGRFAHPQAGCQRTDIQLDMLQEGGDDPQAVRIAECSEQFGGLGSGFFVYGHASPPNQNNHEYLFKYS